MSNNTSNIERTLKKVTERYDKVLEELEEASDEWAEALRSAQTEAEVATEAFEACSKATGCDKLFDEWYEQQREAGSDAHDLMTTAAMSKLETLAGNLVDAGLDLKNARSSFLRTQGGCR